MHAKQLRGSAGARWPPIIIFGSRKWEVGARNAASPLARMLPGCWGKWGWGGQEPCTSYPHPILQTKQAPKAASRLSASEEVQAGCHPSGCSFPSHYHHQQHPWRMWVPRHGSISA